MLKAFTAKLENKFLNKLIWEELLELSNLIHTTTLLVTRGYCKYVASLLSLIEIEK